MAMLAEPRRKQKVINLRAKNNAWSNDTNKFGQRMLEKMGWSSGKGLGAHENGIVEHVVARYKNDDKGLGFEDKNDQWTKHEDDFNALLANLSNGDKDKEEKLHSGVSLEVKSKKSKARVHYHKYTRGKDLTRYSAKDLANIFGKKSLKNEEKVKETLKDDVKVTEQIFTEKGSMEDYFKNKLASFKSKTKISILNGNQDDEADYAFRGFSGTANDELDSHQMCAFKSFAFDSTSVKEMIEVNDNIPEYVSLDKKNSKINKKSKTSDISEDNSQDNNSNDNSCSLNDESLNVKEEDDIQELPKKKKKKKHKIEKTEPVVNSLANKHIDDIEHSEQLIKIKKSKKKKYQDEQRVLEVAENDKECVDSNVPKKKKKRKNKEYEN